MRRLLLVLAVLLVPAYTPAQNKFVEMDGGRMKATTTATFAAPTLTAGDGVGWALFRDATGGNAADTLASAINIVSVSATGVFWR